MVPIIGGALHSTGGCPLPRALVRSTERGGNPPMPTQFPSPQRQARHREEHRTSSRPPSLRARRATRYGTASGRWALGLTCLCLLSGRHMAPGSIQQQGIFFLTWDKSTFLFPGMSVYVHRPLSTTQNVRHLHAKTMVVRISWIKLKMAEVQGKRIHMGLYKNKNGL